MKEFGAAAYGGKIYVFGGTDSPFVGTINYRKDILAYTVEE